MATDKPYTGKLTKPSWYDRLYGEADDKIWSKQARFLEGISIKLAENFRMDAFTKGDGLCWRVIFRIAPGEGPPPHGIYCPLKLVNASDPQVLAENQYPIRIPSPLWAANKPVRSSFVYMFFRRTCKIRLALVLKNERSLEWRSPIIWDYAFDYGTAKDPRWEPNYMDNAFERIVIPMDMLKQTVKLQFRGSQVPQEYSFKNLEVIPSPSGVFVEGDWTPVFFKKERCGNISVVEPIVGRGVEQRVYFSRFTTPRIYAKLRALIDHISNAVLEAIQEQKQLLKVIQTRAESRLLHEVPEGLEEAGVLSKLPGARFGVPPTQALKVAVGTKELVESGKLISEISEEERSVGEDAKALDRGTSDRGVTRKQLTADETPPPHLIAIPRMPHSRNRKRGRKKSKSHNWLEDR